MTRELEAALAALAGESVVARRKAAKTLVRLCAKAKTPPFGEVLDALKERRRPGPKMERDPKARQALFEAANAIGAHRARKEGMLVPRPRGLAKLEDDRLTWLVIERVWDAADIYRTRKVLRSILDLATPGQCALYAIWWTQSEVNNGGFHQYFWNATGILADEALEGFRRIGAEKFADVLEAAMSIIEQEAKPADKRQLRRIVDRIDPKKFRKLDDRFFALEKGDKLFKLTAAYVREHPEEFFRSR